MCSDGIRIGGLEEQHPLLYWVKPKPNSSRFNKLIQVNLLILSSNLTVFTNLCQSCFYLGFISLRVFKLWSSFVGPEETSNVRCWLLWSWRRWWSQSGRRLISFFFFVSMSDENWHLKRLWQKNGFLKFWESEKKNLVLNFYKRMVYLFTYSFFLIIND